MADIKGTTTNHGPQRVTGINMNNVDDGKIDAFPEKRSDVKPLDDEFDFSSVDHILHHVMQFLLRKSMHEMRPQDKANSTHLGNVMFHIKYNKLDNTTKIVFDKHPKTWKIDDIYRDIDNMECDIALAEQGGGDIFDVNPFTY